MSVRTTAELREILQNIIGEDTSDEALSAIEDFEDTLTSLENSNDGVDWKAKYEQNDADWRQKYKDRFFTKAGDENDNDEDEMLEEKTKQPTQFSDLFKTE